MATILRNPGRIYGVTYDKAPLDKVANSERTFPKSWISPDGRDVTDDYVRYAAPLMGEDMPTIPLIGGRQRLARLQPIFADQMLPAYMPEAARKNRAGA
jgi:6-phosphofructokinase 1